MNYDIHPQLDRIAADYVLGTMPARVRRRFEAVLGGSAAARAAVDAWSERLHALSRVDFDLDPSPVLFDRIERRIDPAARAAAGTDREPPARRPFGWGWLRPAAGFAFGVLLTLALTLVQRPAYETLTSPAPRSTSPQRPTLRVLFAPGTTVEQANASLRTVGASIVAGPSELGVLTVALPPGQSPAAALATLRAQPAVRLAEPVVEPKAAR